MNSKCDRMENTIELTKHVLLSTEIILTHRGLFAYMINLDICPFFFFCFFPMTGSNSSPISLLSLFLVGHLVIVHYYYYNCYHYIFFFVPASSILLQESQKGYCLCDLEHYMQLLHERGEGKGRWTK